mgnify:FL=1
MPNIVVVDHARPVPGTTVSVVDGTILPATRTNTTLVVAPRGTSPSGPVDVAITQLSPSMVSISTAGITTDVEVELFRAENRYVTTEAERAVLIELEPAQ